MGKQRDGLVSLWHQKILKADSVRITPEALGQLSSVLHQVDFSHTEVCSKTFGMMIRAAPTKMKVSRECLLFFVSLELDTRYRGKLAERSTLHGDDGPYMMLPQKYITPYGIRLVSLFDFPEGQILLTTVDRVHVSSYALGKQYIVDALTGLDCVRGYNVALYPTVEKFNLRISQADPQS